jgi:periplasmic protein TonB
MISSPNWSDPLRLRMFRWTVSALFAVALHAGVLSFLLYSRDSTEADIAGSIAIELAPITAGSPVEMPDVPLGPLAPEQTAASEATKQIAKQEPIEAPSVDPSPLAPDPEVSLPIKRPEEKKEPEEKAEHAPQDSQVLEAAPAIGLSGAALQAQSAWQRDLVSRINRYKRYPATAATHRVEGVVTVQFTVDRAGVVLASQVLHSSGSPLLDDEAITMLRRAAPLPAPPAQAQAETFEFVLPIHFKIP